MSVEELGEIMELRKGGAGDTDTTYQFVDVREEDELGKAKLPGERGRESAVQGATLITSRLDLSQTCFTVRFSSFDILA